MNISSSHVQNTFFLWTLWYGNWTGDVKFPSIAGCSVNSHTTSPHPHSCLKCPCVDGVMLYVIDWTTLGREKFDARVQLPYHSVQRKKVFWTWLEEMFISSNMRGDISLLNVYCGAAMIEVYLCSKKICDSMGFWAANRPRVDEVRPLAVFLCCLYFVLWREWQRWQRSNNNRQKTRLNRWIHTKNHRNTSKVTLLYLLYRELVTVKISLGAISNHFWNISRWVLLYFISHTK